MAESSLSQKAFVLERNNVMLVFGLEWFPLLGSRMDRQAAALARQRTAAYRVVSAGEAASVGLLYEKLRRSRSTRMFSAAAVFAALHRGGTTAAIVPMPCGRRWLVAVHESAVITLGDACFETDGALHAALDRLREAHPGLSVLSMSASEDVLEDLFQAAVDAGELVRTSKVVDILRRPLVVAVVVMAAGILAGRGLLFAEPQAQGGVSDPRSVWRAVSLDVARRYSVHGVTNFHSLYEALLDTPAVLAGWVLQGVDCQPMANRWQCRSRYRRTPAAVNQGLLSAAPAEWTLSFDPLDGAEAVWSAPMEPLPLASVTLRTVADNDARLLSVIQEMSAAFSELRFEGTRPIPFTPPLDEHRQSIPRPAGIPLYHSRPLRLQAPLRSISLLLPEMTHMSWERVSLSISSHDHPTLRTSGLRLSLTGTLYEIDGIRTLDDRHSRATHGERADGRGGGSNTVSSGLARPPATWPRHASGFAHADADHRARTDASRESAGA